MKRRNILLAKIMLMSFLLFASRSDAQEDVYMKIQKGDFQRIRIAVERFTAEQPTDLAETLRQIVIDDLEFSGFFRIVGNPGADGLRNPQSGNHPNPSAEVKLEGKLILDGGAASISARLKELPGEQTIFNKTFSSSLGAMRWLAHQAADEVVYYLIGEQGIASTRIAYASGSGMIKEISLVDYDGHNHRKLTDTDALNLSPSWSPDGAYLLFTSYLTGNPDLIRMDMRDGKLTWISKQKGLHIAPAWSPKKHKIAFTFTTKGNADIYTMNPDGGDWRRLTQSPAIDTSPSWSPTGNQIAFTSDRSGNPHIYLMDAEGGNVRRLTFVGTYNASPAWSPRGDRIAFVSRDEGHFQIYTISVDGENLQRITDGIGNNENPSWSPDGLKLAFASDREGSWDIYVIGWDGRGLRKVTHSGNNVTAEWSPRLKAK